MNHPLWRWIIGVASATRADRVLDWARGSIGWLSHSGLLTLFALIMADLPAAVAQSPVLQLPAQANPQLRAASTMPQPPARLTPEVTVNSSLRATPPAADKLMVTIYGHESDAATVLQQNVGVRLANNRDLARDMATEKDTKPRLFF